MEDVFLLQRASGQQRDLRCYTWLPQQASGRQTQSKSAMTHPPSCSSVNIPMLMCDTLVCAGCEDDEAVVAWLVRAHKVTRTCFLLPATCLPGCRGRQLGAIVADVGWLHTPQVTCTSQHNSGATP